MLAVLLISSIYLDKLTPIDHNCYLIIYRQWMAAEETVPDSPPVHAIW